MRRFLNILLLVLTLLAMTAMGIYFAHSHFNDSLDDVNITITRNHENGFLDYEEIFNTVMNICDTVNNKQIKNIDVESIVENLRSNKWVTNVHASINLKSVLEIEIEECEPILRIYNSDNKSVYVDNQGNMYPSENDYVPHVLICSGYIDFQETELGNVNDEIYAESELQNTFILAKEVLKDKYSSQCVKQIYVDKKKNYKFSLTNTNIIVIFGDVNNIAEKLFNMEQFFKRMQGNPELDNYKEINLNYKNQVVCTKNKNKKKV